QGEPVLGSMAPEVLGRDVKHRRERGHQDVVERRLHDPPDVEDDRPDGVAIREAGHANAGMTCFAMRSNCLGSSVTGPSAMYSSPADTRSAIRALMRSMEPTM